MTGLHAIQSPKSSQAMGTTLNENGRNKKKCNLYAQRLFIFYIICMSRKRPGKERMDERTNRKKNHSTIGPIDQLGAFLFPFELTAEPTDSLRPTTGCVCSTLLLSSGVRPSMQRLFVSSPRFCFLLFVCTF